MSNTNGKNNSKTNKISSKSKKNKKEKDVKNIKEKSSTKNKKSNVEKSTSKSNSDLKEKSNLKKINDVKDKTNKNSKSKVENNKKTKLKTFKLEKKVNNMKVYDETNKKAKNSNMNSNSVRKLIEVSKEPENKKYKSEYIIYKKDIINKLENEKKKLEEQNEKIRKYLKDYLKEKELELQEDNNISKIKEDDKFFDSSKEVMSEVREKEDENFKITLGSDLKSELRELEKNSTIENTKKEEENKIYSEEFDADDKFKTKIYSWNNVLEESEVEESNYQNNITDNKKGRRKRRLEREKRKGKKKNIIRKVIVIILTTILISSAIYIAKWLYDNFIISELDKKNEQIIEKATEEKKHGPKLNMEELRKINDQSAFLLNFELFDIKKVVVKGNDNDFYLRHDFKKQYNFAGWVFLDCRNKMSDDETNYIIYAHNMRDGKTMFSQLPKMLDKNFLEDLKEEDKIIKIRNEKGEYEYKIFSVHQMKDEKTTSINLLPEGKNELQKLVNEVKAMSIYDFKVDTNNANQIITLMTCGTTNNDRVMIHAIKVD